MNGDGASSRTQGREKVPAEILQATLLADLDTGIRQLIELIELQIAVGQAPFVPLTVTTDLREVQIAPAWFSVKIINDGPQLVLVHVNDTDELPIRIASGEDVNLDFGAPRVRLMFFRTESATAELRLIGLY